MQPIPAKFTTFVVFATVMALLALVAMELRSRKQITMTAESVRAIMVNLFS